MAHSITPSLFGTMPDGSPVEAYALENSNGLACKVITYGGVVTELHVPGRDGSLADIVLGFDNLSQYLTDSPCFGAIVGRVANRIAAGRFTVDGKAYTLAINNPPNTLHGGKRGFDKRLWRAEPGETADGPSVAFSRVSP